MVATFTLLLTIFLRNERGSDVGKTATKAGKLSSNVFFFWKQSYELTLSENKICEVIQNEIA